MRTREEINRGVYSLTASTEALIEMRNAAMLEILLDIREVIQVIAWKVAGEEMQDRGNKEKK